MMPAVQFTAEGLIARLAVFVGFAGLEGLAVDHGDRILKTLLQARKLSQIGAGRYGHLAAELL